MINTKSHTLLGKIIDNRTMLLMISPIVLFFIVFSYLPMLGVILAFKSYNFADGIVGSPFNGLENFRFLFVSGDALVVLRNTILYNIAFIIVNNILQVICAVILSEITSRMFKKVTQAFMFLPYIMSWVIIGAIAYNMFNYEFGSLNSILISLNYEPVDIYGTIELWPFIIVAICAWKGIGYGTILYLATIMGIDQEMYEAAEIDGVNIMQKIWYITLPFMKPTVIILVLLSVGNIFRGDFSMFYQLVGNNSVLFPATDVIDTFVTRSLLFSNEVGMSAAAGFLQSTFGLVAILIVNGLVRKYEKGSALF